MERQGRGRRISPQVRRALQEGGESVAALAERHGVNPKTVRRWRSRGSLLDRKTGPRQPRSTVLDARQEATVVGVRRLTLLPLDDCFYALRTFIPGLTRASLHRCLRRHGVSRLPPADRASPPGAFDLYLFEFDGRAADVSLFIAVERASKYVFGRICVEDAGAAIGSFLLMLAEAAPVKVRTIVTERRGKLAGLRGETTRACAAIGAAHASIEPRWTPEQLARIDAVMMQAARSHAAESTIAGMQRRMEAFAEHFNGQCRLKALGGQTPQAFLSLAASGASERAEHGAEGPQASPALEPAARAGRERAPEATREAILAAARALLARVGPEGLSLSEVARMAGVNRGTAYQHFKSRKQLIAATAAWSSEQLHQAVFAALNPQDDRPGGRYAVTDVATRLAGFAMENPEICQAWLFQFLASPSAAEDPFWREWFGAAQRFHATPLAQDGIDSEVLAITQLAGFFLWPTWARRQIHDPAEQQAFARRFVRETLRYCVYGVFRAEHQPEVMEILRREMGEAPGASHRSSRPPEAIQLSTTPASTVSGTAPASTTRSL